MACPYRLSDQQFGRFVSAADDIHSRGEAQGVQVSIGGDGAYLDTAECVHVGIAD